MTREEYIDFANALKNNYTIDFDKLPEFCDMAISALSTEPKKGEWIEHRTKNGTIVALTCPKCLKSPKNAVRSDFCPNCRADLREVEE